MPDSMAEQLAELKIRVHFDQGEIYPGGDLAVDERQETDGVHCHGNRKVYVTVDGDFAGTMSFSTGAEDRERYAMCYGQRDQILGVPEQPGEEPGAMFIASRYRKGAGW